MILYSRINLTPLWWLYSPTWYTGLLWYFHTLVSGNIHYCYFEWASGIVLPTFFFLLFACYTCTSVLGLTLRGPLRRNPKLSFLCIPPFWFSAPQILATWTFCTPASVFSTQGGVLGYLGSLRLDEDLKTASKVNHLQRCRGHLTCFPALGDFTTAVLSFDFSEKCDLIYFAQTFSYLGWGDKSSSYYSTWQPYLINPKNYLIVQSQSLVLRSLSSLTSYLQSIFPLTLISAL